MFNVNSELVKELRGIYTEGTRVKLTKDMDDPYCAPKKGDMGTVSSVDDIGTIHVLWDMGSSLGLIPDVDSFEVVKEEGENEK